MREGTFVRRHHVNSAPSWSTNGSPPCGHRGSGPPTWASYRMAVDRHIVPTLAGVVLQALTPAHLATFYRGLLDDGRRDGRGGLSPKSVRNIHGVLDAALRDAVRWGYLPRNSATSSSACGVTRSMRPGCCSSLLACGVARSPVSAGPTST